MTVGVVPGVVPRAVMSRPFRTERGSLVWRRLLGGWAEVRAEAKAFVEGGLVGDCSCEGVGEFSQPTWSPTRLRRKG
jgi:hypothetical protein